MGVHEELAELAAGVGEGVFGDAEVFRAVLDDYLADDMATRGEINLLVDAVRLGVFQRLAAQVDNGAEAGSAIDVLGDQLARDRGTSEARSARWAIAALAFAVGRAGEDEVLSRRAAMEAEPTDARPAWHSTTEMPAVAMPDERTDEPPTGTALAARAPTTILTPGDAPDRLRQADDTGDDDGHEGMGRTVRTVAAVVAVVALLVGAGLALRAVDDGDGDGDEDPAVVPDASTTAAPFTSAEVVGGRSRSDGVRSDRTYRLTNQSVVSAVELTNTTKKPVTRLWAEVVPKEIAEHVSEVSFKPRYTGLIKADPVVYWRVRLPAGATRKLQWSTKLPEKATPSEDYLNLVVGWHEVAITDATPLIERKLAALAREGESVIKPPTPVAPEITDRPSDLDIPTDVIISVTPSDDEEEDEEDDPPPQPPPNRAPRLSLGSKSTGEQVGASYAVRASDPDGDSWSIVAVSGAPAGIGTSGAHSLGGTVSHRAASSTTDWRSLRTSTRTVRVTIADEHGATDTGTFSWTVTDTHRLMPRYVGTDGNNQHLVVQGSARSHCYDSGLPAGYSMIRGQSITSGTVIRWGASVRYDWSHNPNRGSDPPC